MKLSLETVKYIIDNSNFDATSTDLLKDVEHISYLISESIEDRNLYKDGSVQYRKLLRVGDELYKYGIYLNINK